MKSLDEIQRTLREQKPYLAEKYGVKIVGGLQVIQPGVGGFALVAARDQEHSSPA